MGLEADVTLRTTLKARIAAQLREWILKGELKPGSMIKAGEIAERLGVSRGPVREAIWQLVQEGLVTHDPHHTPLVVDLSPRDAWEIYTLRGGLEALAVQLAVSNVTQPDIDYLEEVVVDMEMLRAGDSVRKALELDLEFHGRICALSGHGRLIETFRAMDAANGSVFLSAATLLNWSLASTGARHRPILDALKERDAGRAVQLISEHYGSRAREFLQMQE
ncbi:MAG: GntR family transcriptional regulator [Bacillota bacterium]